MMKAMQPSAIILDAITAPGLTIRETAQIAASCGYDGVSLWVSAPYEGLPFAVYSAGSDELREARRVIEGAGLFVNGVEVFDLSSTRTRDAMRSALDAAAELGAGTATAVCFAPMDTGALVDRLGVIAKDAAERDMWISLEFMAPALAGDLNSLARANEVIDLVALDNVGLTMDMLHLTRTGATVEQIAAVPPERIRYIQLCDGPRTMAEDKQIEEAGFGRLYPGEGEFALQEMLAVLPDGKPVGLEIPRRERPSKQIPAEALAAARACLQMRPG